MNENIRLNVGWRFSYFTIHRKYEQLDNNNWDTSINSTRQ
jgi:hypothetical protein